MVTRQFELFVSLGGSMEGGEDCFEMDLTDDQDEMLSEIKGMYSGWSLTEAIDQMQQHLKLLKSIQRKAERYEKSILEDDGCDVDDYEIGVAFPEE